MPCHGAASYLRTSTLLVMTSFAPVPVAARILAAGLVLTLILGGGCVPWRTPRPPELQAAQAAFGTVSTGRIVVHEDLGKPRVTSVVRQGDPAAAIAALVLTGGDSQQSVALAAVVTERLRAAQVPHVEVHPDRLGYRVRALVLDPNAARTLLVTLRAVLEQPIEPGGSEISAATHALLALHHHPLDPLEAEAIAACTGELGKPASSPRLDLSTPDGVRTLEAWRKAFHGAQRTAIAVVGPPAVGDAVRNHIAADTPWPDVVPPDDPWPAREHVGAYFLSGGNASTPRLTVAARVGQTFAVPGLAESAFHASSPLADRLAAATSWRLIRSTATVRPRGACLAITVERDPARKDADLAQDGARIAALLTHELQAELKEARSDASVAGEIVLGAADPRDAASLAVWWSHAARLQPGVPRVSVALGVPPPSTLDPRAGADLDRHVEAIQMTLRTALPRLAATWLRPNLETVSRVENGQGQLWLLLASPCGTAAETNVDAGFTALAAIASAHARNGEAGVTLEPWVAQDGVGILAHAAPRVGESPGALARRVSNAAASALLGTAPADQVVESARGRLLSLIEAPDGLHSEGFGLLARTLSPRQPAWLAPFGLRKSILEADARSISLRRTALSNGPLRLSILANTDAQQAEAAVSAVDRWLVHRSATPRTCPPVPASPSPASDAMDFTLHTTSRSPHAWLGVAVRTPTPSDRLMLDMLRETLAGPDGLLSTAFRSFEGPVRVATRTTGQRRMAALAIEIHCADELIDRALLQTRAVLARVQQGAVSEPQLRRALAAVEADRLERQLDPHVRVAQTWRRQSSAPQAPSLQEWKTWLAQNVSDEAVGIVRVHTTPAETKPD